MPLQSHDPRHEDRPSSDPSIWSGDVPPDWYAHADQTDPETKSDPKALEAATETVKEALQQPWWREHARPELERRLLALEQRHLSASYLTPSGQIDQVAWQGDRLQIQLLKQLLLNPLGFFTGAP